MSTATINEVRKRAPVPRHEILAAVRGDMERTHRESIWINSAWHQFCPCPFAAGSCSGRCHDDVADMSPRHAEDCCNKTVPIYVIPSSGAARHLIAWCLNNWLYRRWYKPYRNEIEHCRFIAKQFYTCPALDQPLVPLVNSLHERICNQVKAYQKDIVTRPVTPEVPGEPCFRDQRFLILQPLFEAITIIILADDFNIFIPNLDNLPCLITLTGQNDNLSAPISFSTIKHEITNYVSETAVNVPLHVAYDFIMSLEQREMNAFGLQPDPIESAIQCHDKETLGYDRQHLNSVVRDLGGGDDPVTGPSSTWVNTTVYTGLCDAMVLLEKGCSTMERLTRRMEVNMFFRANTSQPLPSRRYSI
ncbi:hypothetical protein FPOAC1_004194 [Fusarium poae]|uniref:hypothetical protein n=1 Tax=Fusarium poae TaxID=36050 RepID=UPI001CE74877|nr:hypothetical protein FPOAC1_004194 [Fusarium poae]KAG8670959.1 hypothetical protein FPOAC1_004194 [Fusarium poae]